MTGSGHDIRVQMTAEELMVNGRWNGLLSLARRLMEFLRLRARPCFVSSAFGHAFSLSTAAAAGLTTTRLPGRARGFLKTKSSEGLLLTILLLPQSSGELMKGERLWN